MVDGLRIRDFEPRDSARVHAMNEAAAPAVNSVPEAELTRLAGFCAAGLTAERNGDLVGFLFALKPNQPYSSQNYLWFHERLKPRGADFVYIDRIAVSSEGRNNGVGAALYATLSARIPPSIRLCCEVNTTPPNPGSLRFHMRLGFQEVGRGVLEPGRREVMYLEKRRA